MPAPPTPTAEVFPEPVGPMSTMGLAGGGGTTMLGFDRVEVLRVILVAACSAEGVATWRPQIATCQSLHLQVHRPGVDPVRELPDRGGVGEAVVREARR